MSSAEPQRSRVISIERVSASVLQFEFSTAGHPRTYAPGSHLVVHIPGGPRNAYSLIDDGIRVPSYRIAVRLGGDSGGSRLLHDRLRVGDEVLVERPVSAFPPIATAAKHLYVAGGIGVTPILSHVRSATRWGLPFTVISAHREGDAPFADELRRLCGSALVETHGRAELAAEVARQLAVQPLGTHAYACGPPGLLLEFTTRARALGWPESRIHVEHFSAPDLDAGTEFRALIASSGAIVTVPSGTSLLEALEAAGYEVPNMCRRGVCGRCRVPVVGGTPQHRDLVQSPAQRARNDHLYACVSRALTEELKLDL